MKLLSRAEGCGQNLNDPWVETSAWFEVRVRRGYTIHQVLDLSIDFGNIETGNRIAGNMVNVRVFAESGHSVRMAGSASVLAKSAGPETLTVPLLEDACGHHNGATQHAFSHRHLPHPGGGQSHRRRHSQPGFLAQLSQICLNKVSIECGVAAST